MPVVGSMNGGRVSRLCIVEIFWGKGLRDYIKWRKSGDREAPGRPRLALEDWSGEGRRCAGPDGGQGRGLLLGGGRDVRSGGGSLVTGWCGVMEVVVVEMEREREFEQMLWTRGVRGSCWSGDEKIEWFCYFPHYVVPH